ncbi:MAG: patatin-like phospholipase family protein, partial [Acidobacteria bacterium]|nr:patatin-like phospholipase family protein [Acidobacteriota bacterium]
TVKALRRTRLIELSRPGWEALVAERPETALALARVVMQRLQDSLARRSSAAGASSVVVVPLSPGEATRFAARLAGALSVHGPTLHVDEGRARGMMGSALFDDEGAPRVATLRFLGELEEEHRFLVYDTGPSATPFARLALSQADRVLLVADVADARDGEEARAIEEELPRGDTAPRTELILLGGGPGATARWLRPRSVAAHHHLADDPADLARVARFLAGRAVAVVLSGGGARTLSHLGALRAIEALGIPVDLVGGSSGGAIIAALFAAGLPHEERVRLTRRGFLESGSLLRPVMPLNALLSSRPFERLLEGMFGDAAAEDLRRPWFAVATNLSRNRVEVMRTGTLRDALLAGMAVPGIGSPVVRGGDLLVDGCVASILPSAVARSLDAGVVVGIDASNRSGLRTSAGGRVFNRSGLPSLIDVLLASALYGRDAEAEASACDVVVRPALAGIETLDFARLSEMAHLAEEETRRVLEPWWKVRTA